jgi:hypothetical protein
MARKKNVIKCSCKQCTWGMHHSSFSKSQMKNCVQKVRHHTKQLLNVGEYDKALDFLVSAGYLD